MYHENMKESWNICARARQFFCFYVCCWKNFPANNKKLITVKKVVCCRKFVLICGGKRHPTTVKSLHKSESAKRFTTNANCLLYTFIANKTRAPDCISFVIQAFLFLELFMWLRTSQGTCKCEKFTNYLNSLLYKLGTFPECYEK